MTRRIIAAVPVVNGVGVYDAQSRRYRIESVCGLCEPVDGVFMQLAITSGGPLGYGTLLGLYTTAVGTLPFGLSAFTLGPGVQLAESRDAWPSGVQAILTGPIPHELWIEQGWQLTLYYRAVTLPANPGAFQLVLTLQ